MNQKIVIDSITLLSSLTGIGRYTYEISKYLHTIPNINVDHFYGYYSKQLINPESKKELKRLKALIVKNSFIKKYTRTLLFHSSKLFAPTYDIYWQPGFIPNAHIKAKKIVTSVHDFSFILHKEYHPKDRIAHMEKYFFNHITLSDKIITGSYYTKSEILDRLHFNDNDIEVIYHGINHNIFKVYNNPNINLNLPKNYILYVGSIEPRKNLLGLLKAYALLSETFKRKYHLVLVGAKGWSNDEILQIINHHKDKIHYYGFVDDKELAYIYNLADLFVFPSFYEGFGLPPLEAMATGTAVITSNLTSMPEICKDAALYFNPYKPEEIKNRIEEVLLNKTLQQDMIQKGLKRAKYFTWEKSAQAHLSLFKSLGYETEK